jgi:hypothetical protein
MVRFLLPERVAKNKTPTGGVSRADEGGQGRKNAAPSLAQERAARSNKSVGAFSCTRKSGQGRNPLVHLVVRKTVARAKIHCCILFYKRGRPRAKNPLLRLVVRKSGHGEIHWCVCLPQMAAREKNQLCVSCATNGVRTAPGAQPKRAQGNLRVEERSQGYLLNGLSPPHWPCPSSRRTPPHCRWPRLTRLLPHPPKSD